MSFKFVTSDNQSIIYAIEQNGDLLYYRDLARNGTSRWDYNGAGQRIGTGWGGFRHVFSGGDGIIYAIEQDGDLLYYRDLARNGTPSWAYNGVGQRIGTGW
ncbi:tachylectin-related carbohydrate-binding protein [Peribacillus sp. NPDC060186]